MQGDEIVDHVYKLLAWNKQRSETKNKKREKKTRRESKGKGKMECDKLKDELNLIKVDGCLNHWSLTVL